MKPWYWPVFSTVYKLTLGFLFGATIAFIVMTILDGVPILDFIVSMFIAIILGHWIKSKISWL